MGKKPFTARQIQSLRKIVAGNALHELLLNLGVDLMLRSSDLLTLRVSDLVAQDIPRSEVQVKQKKTGHKTMLLPLSEQSRRLIGKHLADRNSEDWVFAGQKSHYTGRPISGIQYSRIVKGWCEALGVDAAHYSTHSLRKTKSSFIYSKTKNVEVCRRLLGHQSVVATSAYLGIGDEDAADVAREMVI
jgi:integrase